jgi:hypothetical protein
LTLEWTAPAPCPQADSLRERVSSLLAGSHASAAAVTARGAVRSVGSGYELLLDTEQGARAGHRSVHASSCDEIADAAALIIALAIDPALGQFMPEPVAPAAPTAALPPPVPPPPVLPPAREPRPAQARPPSGMPLGAAVGASFVADWGTLPGVAWGFELALGIELQRVRIEVTGLRLPGQDRTIESNPDRGGTIDLWAGGLRSCYVAGDDDSGIGGCAGVEMGQLRGQGFGADREDTRSVAWLAARLGALLRYQLAPSIAVRGAIEALLPATRPEFLLDNVGVVHRPEPISGRLVIGLELRIR